MIRLLYIMMKLSIGVATAQYYEAQSLDIFVRTLENEEKTAESRRKCSIEMQKSVFPDVCLEILELEIDQPDSRFSGITMFSRLSSLCQVGGPLDELSMDRGIHLLKLESLPPSCRRRIEVRLEDLRYLEESMIGPNIELPEKHGMFKSRANPI